MNLLSQCFLAVLVSQTVLGLGNSLFVLADYNYSLSLFGFYALAHSSTYGYVCYIAFASVVSVILDIVRLLLWRPALLGHTLGLMNTMENFYFVLLLCGIGLKVLGGVIAFLLFRKAIKEQEPPPAFHPQGGLTPPRPTID
eukprot:TRINITY_DN5767_c0_g1_i7.p1 TRINITY_DN5767_c0_g1~~TRINITY_DN5767_c0_g1_i7.p1  ORF type:complete len:152 (-),score=12.58 TRINITY_DN5767_c0_g1_i7:88-510(-)